MIIRKYGIAYELTGHPKWKYKLVEDEITLTNIYGVDYEDKYIKLTTQGELTTKAGYAWDGATKAPDYKAERASLVHDALYQLFWKGKINQRQRKKADELFYKICRQDGVSWIRAKIYYYAVRVFGDKDWSWVDKLKKKIL